MMRASCLRHPGAAEVHDCSSRDFTSFPLSIPCSFLVSEDWMAHSRPFVVEGKSPWPSQREQDEDEKTRGRQSSSADDGGAGLLDAIGGRRRMTVGVNVGVIRRVSLETGSCQGVS